MTTALSPDEGNRNDSALRQMSRAEASERTEAYVKDALADVNPQNFAEMELTGSELAFALRRRFYAYLLSNYVLTP